MQRVLESDDKQARGRVVDWLQHYKRDADLSGLRDKTALAELPELERQACEAFWVDVDALLEKAASRK